MARFSSRVKAMLWLLLASLSFARVHCDRSSTPAAASSMYCACTKGAANLLPPCCLGDCRKSRHALRFCAGSIILANLQVQNTFFDHSSGASATAKMLELRGGSSIRVDLGRLQQTVAPSEVTGASETFSYNRRAHSFEDRGASDNTNRRGNRVSGFDVESQGIALALRLLYSTRNVTRFSALRQMRHSRTSKTTWPTVLTLRGGWRNFGGGGHDKKGPDRRGPKEERETPNSNSISGGGLATEVGAFADVGVAGDFADEVEDWSPMASGASNHTHTKKGSLQTATGQTRVGQKHGGGGAGEKPSKNKKTQKKRTLKALLSSAYPATKVTVEEKKKIQTAWRAQEVELVRLKREAVCGNVSAQVLIEP